jgi:diguanylate cyclase (GGDEF)-like protein
VAESVRREMSTLAMVSDGRTFPVSVSVGVASAGPAELGVTALIVRADDALYQAKRAGRDRCIVAGTPEPLAAPEPQLIGAPAAGRSRP